MKQMFVHWKKAAFGLCLLLGLVFSFGHMVGCAEKKEDQCQSNLSCNDTEACVDVDGVKMCKAKGDLGADCDANGKNGKAPCMSKDSTGREIVCDQAKCTFRCETDLDCDRDKVCDTNSGLCVAGSSGNDAGTGE